MNRLRVHDESARDLWSKDRSNTVLFYLKRKVSISVVDEYAFPDKMQEDSWYKCVYRCLLKRIPGITFYIYLNKE